MSYKGFSHWNMAFQMRQDLKCEGQSWRRGAHGNKWQSFKSKAPLYETGLLRITSNGREQQTLKIRAAIWRDLSRLEEWARRNIMRILIITWEWCSCRPGTQRKCLDLLSLKLCFLNRTRHSPGQLRLTMLWAGKRTKWSWEISYNTFFSLWFCDFHSS